MRVCQRGKMEQNAGVRLPQALTWILAAVETTGPWACGPWKERVGKKYYLRICRSRDSWGGRQLSRQSFAKNSWVSFDLGLSSVSKGQEEKALTCTTTIQYSQQASGRPLAQGSIVEVGTETAVTPARHVCPVGGHGEGGLWARPAGPDSCLDNIGQVP